MTTAFAIVTLDNDQKQKPYIFECPRWRLEKGDNVIVDTCFGEQKGKVIAVKDYAPDEDVEFINALNRNRKIKRVLMKYTLEYNDYADYYRDLDEKIETEQKAREETPANAAAEEVTE